MHSVPVLYQKGSLKYESFQDWQDDIAQTLPAGLVLPAEHHIHPLSVQVTVKGRRPSRHSAEATETTQLHSSPIPELLPSADTFPPWNQE